MGGRGLDDSMVGLKLYDRGFLQRVKRLNSIVVRMRYITGNCDVAILQRNLISDLSFGFIGNCASLLNLTWWKQEKEDIFEN